MSCEVHVMHDLDKVQKNIFYASLSVTTNPFSFELEAGYIFHRFQTNVCSGFISGSLLPYEAQKRLRYF